MSALGSLVVKLALEYAEYTKGLEKSDQQSLKFAQNAQRHFDQASKATSDFMTNVAASIAGTVAAFFTVDAMISQMRSSIDTLANLDDMAQKTGSSVENLSRLQKVASAFSQDFGVVDASISKLAKGMASADDESNKVHKALTALGVSSKDAAGKLRDPSEVLVDVSKRLQSYGDDASKAALLNDLLGKSGADLIPYLNDVAENVDKFSGVSREAAEQASAFQDRMGALREKSDSLFTAIAMGALPAMTDLAGAFLDVAEEQRGLVDGKGAEWADGLAVGLARIVDVAILLPRIISAVGGSFSVVAADINGFRAVLENANPYAVVSKWLKGGSAFDDLKKAADDRNKVLDDANKKWTDLWNKPANEMEQAMLKRIADRSAPASGLPGATTGDKPSLGYETGNKPDTALNDFDQMNKSLQQKLALTAQEIALGRALTASEREMAALTRGRIEGTIKLSDEEARKLAAGMAQLSLNEQLLASRAAAEKLDRDQLAIAQKLISSAYESLAKAQEEVDMFGKLPAEITLANVARLELRKTQLETNEGTADEIRTIEGLIEVNKRLAVAQADKTGLEEAKKAREELDKFLDPTKAQTFGDALKEAFGGAGDAATKLIGSLQSYGIKQAEIDKARKDAAKAYATDSTKFAAVSKEITEKEVKNRISGYGDMAGAAKGFFSENSDGYKALEAAERAFRTIELAMAAEAMLTKSGLLASFTGMFVAAKTTETAAEVASLAPTVAVETAKQGVFGVTALAAALALPFPANLPAFAIVAAMLAAIGVAVAGSGGGGGKGKTTFEDRQEKQGTGTVLGDETAKSESIARSLTIMEENSKLELGYQNAMLTALKNIESALSGAAKGLFQTAGLTGGSAFGTVNSSKSSVLGSSKSTTITDSGVRFSGLLGDLRAGSGKGIQYEDVRRFSDGGLFHGDKTTNSTNTKALGEAAMKPFTLIFDNMGELLVSAGVKLGKDSVSLNAAINQIGIDFAVSTRDLKGQELVDALSAGVGVAFDKVAASVFPGMEQFQKVGEGMGETLVRVAANYSSLDTIFASVGMTFRGVGMDSLAARERLIELSGGIDALGQKTAFFAENFLSEAERMAPVQKMVVDQLAALGYANVDTREEFKNLMFSLDQTTEKGARTHAALLDLAPAFADVYPEIEATTEALVDQAAAQREAASGLLDNVNAALSGLQRAADAEKGKLAEVHSITMKGLQQRVDKESAAFAKHKTLADALHASLNQRLPATAASDRANAQAQIKTALAIARAGGPLPEAEALKRSLSVVSQDASAMFASYQDYERDFYATQNDIASLSRLTDATLSVEQRTLDSLERQKEIAQQAYEAEVQRLDDIVASAQAQIDLLNGMDTKLLTIAQALARFDGSVLAAKADPMVNATASITEAYRTSLGRAPEAAGMEFWTAQVAKGTPLADILNAIKNSPEAKAWESIPGFSGGGSHAGGIRLVGERGPEIEVTGPSRIVSNNEIMASLRSPTAGSDVIAAELQALRAENQEMRKMMEDHLYAIAKYSLVVAEIMEKQEVIGVPPERVDA